MKISPKLAALSVVLLACRAPADAADYQGADAVLKQVETRAGSANGGVRKPDPVHQWREDLRRYQARAATLAPDEAAGEWIGLFSRAVKLPASPGELYYTSSTPPRLLEAFEALPPPAKWDALPARIAALPAPDKSSTDLTTPVLRVVAGVLQNRPETVEQAIDALRRQTDNLDGSQTGSDYGSMIQTLREAFYTLMGDKKGTLAVFEEKLALLRPDADATSSASTREMLRYNSLDVPDLITLAGEPRAEALLKELFTREMSGITVNDQKTGALARKVALEMGDRLKFAPWSLIDGADNTALYETLDRRFPGNPNNRQERRQADAYHLLALILSERYPEATKLAVKIGATPNPGQEDVLGNLPEEALGDLAVQGHAGKVFRFFDGLLAEQPELSYWRGYTTAAVLAGETEPMLARVKAAGERPDLTARAKITLRHAYGEALLAADHVAEALPILREWAVSKRHVGDGVSRGNESQEAAQATATLAVVGQLLGDNALVNEQLDVLVELANTQPAAINGVYVPGGGSLAEMFLSVGRGPDLERLLAASLSQGKRVLDESLAQASAGSGAPNVSYYFQNTRQSLCSLTELYYRAGRYDDIVALLDHADLWGAADLAGVSVSSCGWTGGLPFQVQVARAFQKTGRAEAALRVINAYLEQDGGNDNAYALLLELLPPDKAEARLDALFRGDQFEERPLIWRAVLQLGQGRLDEAEKSARQAISIDPSDGEEGRGDRMRAYAVLGDILERKGDAEKAAQMRQAVRAIRLSEDADRFHAAGLLTRAVVMYGQALDYFADAYCIQSRLAIQLTALGKLDEAMVHYERAYELMPESFGRLESHCFGCERAFAGKRAQSEAERVFLRFVSEQPTNPRVHYLLGYLRMEESRKAEAAHEFGEAVKLDPDYINAWKQLAANTDDPAARDRAALNLLRLDPRQKHDSADLSAVSDLRTLWAAAEAAEKFAPPAASSLYPLEASGRFLQSRPLKPANGAEPAASADSLDPSAERLTPITAILKNKVIAQALQFLPRNNADTITTP